MVRPTYTKVDANGMQWRMVGTRPISELTDSMAPERDGFPAIWWETGRRCKVRIKGYEAWVPAVISIASPNGLSIGVILDEAITDLAVIGIDKRVGQQAVLLVWQPKTNCWEDIVTCTQFEVGVRP